MPSWAIKIQKKKKEREKKRSGLKRVGFVLCREREGGEGGKERKSCNFEKEGGGKKKERERKHYLRSYERAYSFGFGKTR